MTDREDYDRRAAHEDRVTADRVIAVLNRALAKDKGALRALFTHRVPCNGALAEDETIQVLDGDNGFSVSIIGLLNGICGKIEGSGGWGFIVAVFDVVCPVHGPTIGGIGDQCPNSTPRPVARFHQDALPGAAVGVVDEVQSVPCSETLELGDLLEFRRTRE